MSFVKDHESGAWVDMTDCATAAQSPLFTVELELQKTAVPFSAEFLALCI